MPTSMDTYMRRCIELAQKGVGHVAPNPMVGAVLVYEDRIIGEGYHEVYGQAHAEVNCLASVAGEDRELIPLSTMYVSLEPCAHYGKTPPCADLIIRMRIPRVVVGCRDPFEQVNGKGIDRLRAAGVEVTTGVLEKECRELNKRFFTFHLQHRPYILLKWAETADKKIGGATAQRLHISNTTTTKLVHRWRSEEAAIMVGTRTALRDNPSLTNRYWTGKSPVRLVLDGNLRLPATLAVFDRQQPTIVFNYDTTRKEENLQYVKIGRDTLIEDILKVCYELQLQSILVEGGAVLLQSFIDQQCWDEARVITNTALRIGEGVAAPVLSGGQPTGSAKYDDDIIHFYKRLSA